MCYLIANIFCDVISYEMDLPGNVELQVVSLLDQYVRGVELEQCYVVDLRKCSRTDQRQGKV
jgi:hypothetical protein